MKKYKIINNERFHYCMAMEMADWEFTGINNKSHGMASAFSDYLYFKQRCLSFTNKIKKRINEVTTNDDILQEGLLNNVGSLEQQIKKISHKNNNDIEIIAYLFRTTALLLGWDFFEGKIYRTPIYYQTPEQQVKTLSKLSKLKSPFEIAYRKREIIRNLRSKDIPYAQIALIFGTSISNVKQLGKAEHIDELYATHVEQKNKRDT